MKKTEIAFLAMRILAIYVLYRAFDRLIIDVYQVFIQVIMPNGDLRLIITGFIPICLYVLLGVLLWVYSEKIAHHLLMNVNDHEGNTCINAKEIQVIAYSVLGLLVLANSLPELLNKTANAIIIQDSLLAAPSHIKMGTYLSLIEEAIQCAIGLVLLLGAKGLAGLLQIIREAGTTKKDL